jgi:hypothetical protein
MAYSKAELESNGDRASPCFRPFLIGNNELRNICKKDREIAGVYKIMAVDCITVT